MVSDRLLDAALKNALKPDQHAPPRLRRAMLEAVVPGGARLRPRLCLAVAAGAQATGPVPEAAAVAACIELLHCASLVHDDLPCFDNARLRRGRPTIHAVHGEALATLVGDGLIMAAFAHLGELQLRCGHAVRGEIGHAARRMVWGQALESESQVDLTTYHSHKTAALFEAAAVCGAYLLAEAEGRTAPEARHLAAWRQFGGAVGNLYQAADDIIDVAAGTPGVAGKIPGRDDVLDRPNCARVQGLPAARGVLIESLHAARSHLAAFDGGAKAGATVWLTHFEAHLRAHPSLFAPHVSPLAS